MYPALSLAKNTASAAHSAIVPLLGIAWPSTLTAVIPLLTWPAFLSTVIAHGAMQLAVMLNSPYYWAIARVNPRVAIFSVPGHRIPRMNEFPV